MLGEREDLLALDERKLERAGYFRLLMIRVRLCSVAVQLQE